VTPCDQRRSGDPPFDMRWSRLAAVGGVRAGVAAAAAAVAAAAELSTGLPALNS
jgi:hypothetical protein